jgi:hypothetical protein
MCFRVKKFEQVGFCAWNTKHILVQIFICSLCACMFGFIS